MTTGTKTVGSPSVAGYYYRKIWNGGDAPHNPIQKLPRPPPLAYYAWKRMANGTMKQVIRWHRGVPARPPKRARSRGEHPYTMSILERNSPGITTWEKSKPKVLYPDTTYNIGVTYTNPWSANDDLKLIGKLKEKVQGSDFDPSVFIGTGFQTTDLIAGSATKIYKAYKSARKGDWQGAAKHLTGSTHGKFKSSGKKSWSPSQTTASNWLELQYGWLPLLQDAKGGAEMLAHQLNFPISTTYRVTRKIEFTPVSSSPYYIIGGLHGVSRGQIIARISEGPTVPQLLGVTNPENLMWELLPWSFVADWFIPIGQYLDARAFASHLTGTFITTKTVIYGGSGLTFAPSYRLGCSGGGGYLFSSFELSRVVASTLPVPLPNFKPLGKVASYMHAANAVGLLTQMFHRK